MEGPGSKFRKDLPNLIAAADALDDDSSGLPIDDDSEYEPLPNLTVSDDHTGYSGDQGTATEDVVTSDLEFSDGWEHFSDFVVTESSGSDWM